MAGAPAGWAYVWPRDAGAVAIALASAGYREEARRIVRFLLALDLDAAARFDRDGEPVEGRAAQGDAAGWVAAAARAAGVRAARASGAAARAAGLQAAHATSMEARLQALDWRDRADYQEKDGGDYLGNAIASTAAARPEGGWQGDESTPRSEAWIERTFGTQRGLLRVAGNPDSGLDSAAAWAVRPFSTPALYPEVRRTLLRLVAERETRFGLLPSEEWDGGEDPWTAPTAWTAWALAALANGEGKGAAGREAGRGRARRAALTLMADLRRAATPLGLLPERVDAQTGRPSSTTPLAWSHAFAILAIRELWS